MQDISDKDTMIFALNKQLSSLKNLIQSQDLLQLQQSSVQGITPNDISILNQSACINHNLSQIHHLGLVQQKDALRKNRQSMIQTSNNNHADLLTYFAKPAQSIQGMLGIEEADKSSRYRNSASRASSQQSDKKRSKKYSSTSARRMMQNNKHNSSNLSGKASQSYQTLQRNSVSAKPGSIIDKVSEKEPNEYMQ